MKSNSKIEEIKLEIIDNKKLAQNAVLNLLDREEKLSDLQDKTDILKNNSKLFYKKTKKVKNNMFKNKVCAYLIIFFMFLIFFYFILALFCGIDLKECYNYN